LEPELKAKIGSKLSSYKPKPPGPIPTAPALVRKL
jgi:hypothetical protein